MPRLPVAAALTLLTLTACSRTMDDSDIKQNPHPKQAYEITVTIRDAPGPFDSVKGEMAFEVENHDCVPQDPVSGARKVPTRYPLVPLEALGGGRYRGTIYLDLLQDDDYFGLGTCHWQFNGLIVTAHAFNRTFGANFTPDQIRAQNVHDRYVPKDLYAPAPMDDLNYPAGSSDADVMQHPEKFFAIELTAKERQDEHTME